MRYADKLNVDKKIYVNQIYKKLYRVKTNLYFVMLIAHAILIDHNFVINRNDDIIIMT